MKTALSVSFAIALSLLVMGCSSGPPELDKQYMESAAKTGQDVRAMFDRAGGDYSKLTPDEKAGYVKSFSGNEKAAQEFWAKMKSGNVGSRPPAP